MLTDMNLWTTALRQISWELYVLAVPLQEYTSLYHTEPTWRLSQNRDIIHNNIKMNGHAYHDEYTPTNDPRSQQTRSGRHTIFASIMHSQTGQVLLHSSVASATSPEASLDFETNLRNYGNDTSWKSLDYNGNDLWILEGMINKSLSISHDGSYYMKEVSPSISAAAGKGANARSRTFRIRWVLSRGNIGGHYDTVNTQSCCNWVQWNDSKWRGGLRQ